MNYEIILVWLTMTIISCAMWYGVYKLIEVLIDR